VEEVLYYMYRRGHWWKAAWVSRLDKPRLRLVHLLSACSCHSQALIHCLSGGVQDRQHDACQQRPSPVVLVRSDRVCILVAW
jgi:hypothetical protein